MQRSREKEEVMKVSVIKTLTILALAAVSVMTTACSGSNASGNFLSGAGYHSTSTYNQTIEP